MSETTTQTNVDEIAQLLETMPHENVRKPLFLMFAEFLGYASPIVHWAEEACKNPALPKFKRNVIDMDASVIFEKMKKEMGIPYIQECWVNLYPILFQEYDQQLAKMEDDLPF